MQDERRGTEESNGRDGTVDATVVPSTYKVRGRLADAGGTGVFGHSTATTGAARGVFGRVDSTTDGAAGVRGEATAASGGVYGVYGETAADDRFAAGVKGLSTNGANAVRAEATSGNAVEATTGGQGGYGVWGRNTGTSGQPFDHGVVGETYTARDGVAGVKGIANDTGTNQSYGVEGISEAAATSASNPAGVRGEANASSGRSYGVYGTVSSSEGYGVYADTGTAGGPALGTGGDAEIGGTVSKTANATAHRDYDQSIPSKSWTRIEFNAVTGDDFGAFVTDETVQDTGTYVVPEAGDYRVDLQLEWAQPFDAGWQHRVQIRLDGTTRAYEHVQVPGTGGSAYVDNSLSKVLMDLAAGDAITAHVYQDSGTSRYVYGFDQYTYMSVCHVG